MKMRRLSLAWVICAWAAAGPIESASAQSHSVLVSGQPGVDAAYRVEGATVLDTISGVLGMGGSLESRQAGRIIAATIAQQVGTFPTPSAGAALAYTFDPVLAIPVRSTSTFGPAFVDRPATLGKRRGIATAVHYEHVSFDQIERFSLDNLLLGSWIETTAPGTASETTQGVVRASADIVAFSMSATATRNLDIAAVVPFVFTRIDVSTQRVLESTFQSAQTERFSGAASGQGIGDVAVQGKYRFSNRPALVMAVQGEVRFPTGDEQSATGVGATRVGGSWLASTRLQAMNLHANLGYSHWFRTYPEEAIGDQIFPPFFNHHHEVLYAVGADWRFTDNLTASSAFRGRRLFDFPGVALQSSSFSSPGFQIDNTFLSSVRGDLSSNFGSAGVKWNMPTTNFVVGAHALFPVGSSGLRARPTVSVGLEYLF
jgi:hypothetical protein